jgi:16S rRNA (adenine1518-N6/adenine1519-N6)-dimethyltransferase
VLEAIVDALQLTGGETVIEIGPGRGALTDLLIPRAARVVAVELDRLLAAKLRERYAGDPRVEIVEADVLKVNIGELARGGDFVLAGNVPYYITTPILFHALERPRPLRAVYLVQREVAERVVAAHGSKEYGALSVNVQAVARSEILLHVPPAAFVPPPKVDSAVMRVAPRADPVVTADEENGFRAFVQQLFTMRRKQMRRVLRSVAALDVARAEAVLTASGVDPDVRPETLSPESLATVYRELVRPERHAAS